MPLKKEKEKKSCRTESTGNKFSCHITKIQQLTSKIRIKEDEILFNQQMVTSLEFENKLNMDASTDNRAATFSPLWYVLACVEIKTTHQNEAAH